MSHLHALLADGTRFDPHYLPSLNSDHLPMTLCAMSGLGAQDADLDAYRDDYSKILHEFDPAEPVADFRDALGQFDAYPALLALMRQRVADEGVEAVTREVLGRCLSGLIMDAFHPIIRLGYALHFNSAEETAAALAYMVSVHRDLPHDLTPCDFEETLRAQVAAGPIEFSTPRFSRSVMELHKAGSYPTGSAGSLADCAALALQVYRATRNFFALHLVTATQAVRVCAPYVKEDEAVAVLTGSLLAAHQVVGSPAFDEVLPIPERIDREHTWKYAYACVAEYGAYGNEVYLDELRGLRERGLVAEWAGADVA